MATTPSPASPLLHTPPTPSSLPPPLRNIFGYNSQPCFIDVIFYLGFWLLVLCTGLWKWSQGTLSDADYKYKRMMRKQQAEVRG